MHWGNPPRTDRLGLGSFTGARVWNCRRWCTRLVLRSKGGPVSEQQLAAALRRLAILRHARESSSRRIAFFSACSQSRSRRWSSSSRILGAHPQIPAMPSARRPFVPCLRSHARRSSPARTLRTRRASGRTFCLLACSYRTTRFAERKATLVGRAPVPADVRPLDANPPSDSRAAHQAVQAFFTFGGLGRSARTGELYFSTFPAALDRDAHRVEVARLHVPERFGVQTLAKRRRAGDVAEDHADALTDLPRGRRARVAWHTPLQAPPQDVDAPGDERGG
jgi:hypothetical protein